jgi:UDPglucose 6-dehydrogenase
MKITIIGAGYVGLVSGACLAELGHQVTCLDLDEKKISSLSQGKTPIYEAGLEDILQKNLKDKRISFTTSWKDSIPKSDVVFIAVGTPTSRRGNGYADMSYVYEAARSLAPFLQTYTVVVNKSTVPVGAAREVRRLILETHPQANFDVASNPEFLREGEAIQDFMHPDRIIIGVDSDRAKEVLKKIYQAFDQTETPILFTNLETAELTKYAANSFLAAKVSFINEMSHLCEAIGGDVEALAHGIGLDHRIGPKFLHPGPGYGGSCFPKDTTALLRIAQEHGAPLRIVETVVEVNHAQKARMIKKIRDALGGSETGKTLAVLGLTFKPNTDDMRDAPALTILPALLEKGLKIRAHDPEGMGEAKNLLPDLIYCEDPYQACEGADAVCVMTEWNLYRSMDLILVKERLKTPLMIDLRNIFSLATMKTIGFDYISLGRRR